MNGAPVGYPARGVTLMGVGMNLPVMVPGLDRRAIPEMQPCVASGSVDSFICVTLMCHI